MSELDEAVTELIIMAGRVSIDLPIAKAEELSLSLSRATSALHAHQPPAPAPITADDVLAAERAWSKLSVHEAGAWWDRRPKGGRAAFVADWLNRRGER